MILRKLKKRPILSGVVSSLIASIIVAIFTWLASSQLLQKPYPLWVSLLIVVPVIGLSVSLIIYLINRPKQIFIIISAFSKKQYFSDLLQNISIELEAHGFEAVVKIPSRDYSGSCQSRQFNYLQEHRENYVGGIVVPIEPHEREYDIRQFYETMQIPIVFVDTRPFLDEKTYTTQACFVGFNSKHGGCMAAKALHHELDKKNINNPNILIIGSNVQAERQEAFEDEITKLLCHAKVIKDEKGFFQRDIAKSITGQYIRDFEANGQKIDAIFCTNDEMAIGAVQALSEFPKTTRNNVLVVGYDAIDEAKNLVNNPCEILVNTIEQRTSILAEKSVENLVKLLRGEKVPVVTLIEPSIFKPII